MGCGGVLICGWKGDDDEEEEAEEEDEEKEGSFEPLLALSFFGR